MGEDQARVEGIRLRYPSDIGHTINAERQSRQMTQAEFAAEVGVSRKWLSEVENGKATVELGLVLAVFRKLELDLVAAERPRPPFDFDAALRSLTDQPSPAPPAMEGPGG